MIKILDRWFRDKLAIDLIEKSLKEIVEVIKEREEPTKDKLRLLELEADLLEKKILVDEAIWKFEREKIKQGIYKKGNTEIKYSEDTKQEQFTKEDLCVIVYNLKRSFFAMEKSSPRLKPLRDVIVKVEAIYKDMLNK